MAMSVWSPLADLLSRAEEPDCVRVSAPDDEGAVRYVVRRNGEDIAEGTAPDAREAVRIAALLWGAP